MVLERNFLVMNKVSNKINSANKEVWVAAGIFFAICFLLQCWRLQTLTASMDQGIFFQVLWNGVHGRLFQSTLSSQLSTNVIHSGEMPALGYYRLGQHFTPILAIWVPFIGVLGKWALPLIQVSLITLGGVVLYNLANISLDKNNSKMIAFSYFCANTVIGPCLGNFTDLCQLPVLFFSLILAIEKRINWLIIITFLLIPLIREDAGVLLVGIGIWLLFRKNYQWRLALVLILYGAGWVLLVTNVLMPIFSEDNSKRFMVENFGQFIKNRNEASSLDVIGLGLQQPMVILKELINPPGQTLRYLAGHALPLVFIPFISIDCWLLMGLPLAGLLLAQGNPLAINWRYTYLVVPGLFSGSIYWWAKNYKIFSSRRFKRFWSGCMALSIIFTITSNPNRTLSWLMPQSIDPWIYRPPINQLDHGLKALKAVEIIPKNGTVSASSNLVPHLADRETLIRFPDNVRYQDSLGTIKKVDWIAVDLSHHMRYAHAFKNEWDDLQEILLLLKSLENDYSPQLVNDGVIVMGFRQESDSLIQLHYKELINRASLISI